MCWHWLDPGGFQVLVRIGDDVPHPRCGAEPRRLNWRDLDARVRALEGQREGAITEAQRGYLYTIVQAWGQARAAREPDAPRNPYAACWATLKARFRLSRYEDLPLREYPAAIAFVRDAYRQLTGAELDIPEQTSPEL